MSAPPRRPGLEVTYVPSDLIHERVPTTAGGMAAYDVVVISDVGANSFQLRRGRSAPPCRRRTCPSSSGRWSRRAKRSSWPVELPAGAERTVAGEHDVVGGSTAPGLRCSDSTKMVPKDAVVLAECAGHPLLVVSRYGQGRSAAFTSDMAPHWAPPPFLAWDGYPELWDRLLGWLSAR